MCSWCQVWRLNPLLLFIRREEEATRRACQRDETIDLEGRQGGSESRCGVGIVFEVAEVSAEASNSQDASWVPLADQDLMVSCLVPGSSAERCGVIQVCILRNLHARPRSLMRDAPRPFCCFNLTNLSRSETSFAASTRYRPHLCNWTRCQNP